MISPLFRRHLLFAGAIAMLFVSFFVGGYLSSRRSIETNMTTSAPTFEHLFDKTKIVCIGRFLIDVPINAQVVYGPTEVPLLIERHPGQAAAMEELIAVRLAEIEKDRYRAYEHLRGKDSMLGRTIEGSVVKQKLVFGVSASGGDFYRIESYLAVGNDLFIQKANPYGARDNYEEAVQKLNSVALLLQARSEQEIPTASGICIDGGFISDSPELTHENLRLGVRLIEFADVHFSIALSKKEFLVESDALEPRLYQAEDDAKRRGNGAWYSHIKILRRGPATIGQWSGFEVLTRKPAQASGGDSHEFAFLSQGEPQNSYLPVLDIKLHTGVKDNQMARVKPSITDDEALVLWDEMTRTIRVRPVVANASDQSISLTYKRYGKPGGEPVRRLAGGSAQTVSMACTSQDVRCSISLEEP